jgi:hypothetical protein
MINQPTVFEGLAYAGRVVAIPIYFTAEGISIKGKKSSLVIAPSFSQPKNVIRYGRNTCLWVTH